MKSNICFGTTYVASLKDVLSYHGIPPGTSHYLPDHVGTTISQTTSAHTSRSDRGAMCLTSPLTTEEGDLLEDMATTLFIRHIPHGCTDVEFMKFIDFAGFRGLYDFYYHPFDRQTRQLRTYAFVNFVSPAVAKAFQIKVHGIQVYPGRHEGPPLCVVPSREQGLQSNTARYYTRTREEGKKRKRSCPIFPVVDFETIPHAEATAKQVIDAYPKMGQSLGWERGTNIFYEIPCMSRSTPFKNVGT